MTDTRKAPLAHWNLTLLWALLILVVLGGFSTPILLNDVRFPFWTTHITFILVFMVGVRYLFFLRHSWLASRQYLKIALVFVCLWAVFFLVDRLHGFQIFSDEVGLESFLGHLPNADYTKLSEFIRNEIVFFGTGSILTTGLMVFRLIISVWRWHNRREV